MPGHAAKGAQGKGRAPAGGGPAPGPPTRAPAPPSPLGHTLRSLGNRALAAGAHPPAPTASPADEVPALIASPAQEAPAPIASPAQEVAAAFHRHGPAAAAAVVGETRAAGSPLGTEAEARAGAHFGVSLGRVRLHDDAFAHDTAALVRANAFTVGDHVFFGAGMLDTGSSAGRLRLLHEIAHTLQHRRPGGSGADPEALERDADRVTAAGAAGVPGMLGTGPLLLREPTYPRRATSTQMLREADRVLGQRRDEDAADPTLRMWSRVPSNFEPDVTCGVLARRVWTSVFLRHFTEPDQRPGVESAHPRYLYSRDYGWIDGQHFFAFIDFAENQVRAAGSRQGGLERATAQGSVIEGNQQRVKDKVILGAPPATDVTRLMQVRGPNTGLFVLPRAAAGTATRLGADLMAWQNLTGAQSELFDQLDPVQRSKFWTDSARSAWSYEDIVSNQLGTRFFLEHGEAINALPPAARPAAFEARLAAFFGSVHVVDDQAVLDSAARDLPGQERYRPPTMDEARARQLHPELFTLPK